MKFFTACLVVILSMSGFFQDASADALLTLGRHAGLKQILIVSPGDTDADSGANLKSALDSVTGTAERPWLIKIEPGIYDLGESSLKMKPYVDIEGSGQSITVIEGSTRGTKGLVQGSANAEIRELTLNNTFGGEDDGVGIGNETAPLVVRNVTIKVVAGCRAAAGITTFQANLVLTGVSVFVSSHGSAVGVRHIAGETHIKDLHVEADTSASDQTVYGIYIVGGGTEEIPGKLDSVISVARGGDEAYGLYLSDSAVEANNVNSKADSAESNFGMEIHANSGPVRVANSSAAAEGGSYASGLRVFAASASFSDVTATATGASEQAAGLYLTTALTPSTVQIDQCRIYGSSYSILNADGDYTIYVGATKLSGPVTTQGTWHCAHTYDETNTVLGESCQP